MLNAERQACWLEDYAFSSLLTERPLMEALPAIIQQHPVLSQSSWQQIRIAVNTTSFTLIPKPLFRKEYASSYLALMRGSALPTNEYAQAYEHTEGFQSVFSIAYDLVDYFSATYPLQPLTFVHQTSTLIQATATITPSLTGLQHLFLYFEDEFVTLVFRAAGALQFCNRFGFKNAQDLTYYVLYVINELGLDPGAVQVGLYGEITPFAETYTRLTQFLSHLTFGQTPPGLPLTNDFSELPEHRYVSLYGLCLLTDFSE